ncbi:AAA family ATPase [Corallococcus exiguus]|uniref:AAA family ATPase n=1 Tax=Corallococcus exiguus TaxID=83462 RepID=UPI003DA5DCFE
MSEITALTYHKLFDPKPVEHAAELPPAAGDQRRVVTYVYTDQIILAVNIALATGRPLLVRGPSGTGKSSLARSAAKVLGFRYYEQVVTSRTQARDMLWQVDHLRRLHDAQSPKRRFDPGYGPYVVPGPLWWAFDEASARKQHASSSAGRVMRAQESGQDDTCPRAVVLIDEIDKADPDTPNNLLVPLGSLQFQVEETGQLVEVSSRGPPLIFVTTNDERELPGAFLRRCIELKLEYPSRERLIEVGRAQFTGLDDALLVAVATAMLPDGEPPSVSPAEYVDVLRGCVALRMSPDSAAFQKVLEAAVWKHGRKEPGR